MSRQQQLLILCRYMQLNDTVKYEERLGQRFPRYHFLKSIVCHVKTVFLPRDGLTLFPVPWYKWTTFYDVYNNAKYFDGTLELDAWFIAKQHRIYIQRRIYLYNDSYWKITNQYKCKNKVVLLFFIIKWRLPTHNPDFLLM